MMVDLSMPRMQSSAVVLALAAFAAIPTLPGGADGPVEVVARSVRASAQDLPPTPGLPAQVEHVDGIVAIVGDSAVLRSDLAVRIQQFLSGRPAPQGEALARLESQVLDQIVGELLIVQAALQDSLIEVADEQIQDQVEREWRQMVQQQIADGRTEADLLAALSAAGYSESTYREYLAAETRRARLYQTYIERETIRRGSIAVTDEEIQQAYDAQLELPDRPARVTFLHLILRPEAADSAWEAAEEEALEARRRIVEEGEPFEDVARGLSDDEGSAEQGGDLEWLRRNEGLDPDFEAAVFSLPANVVSTPVRTMHGYHLIRVERIRGTERRARHILIRPEITAGDVVRGRERALELARRAREGESFTSLLAEYGDPTQQDTLGATIPDLQNHPTFSAYSDSLATLEPGSVVGPFELTDSRDESLFAIVKLIDRIEAGKLTLEEIRPQLERRVRQLKVTEQLIEELRSRMYVEIRVDSATVGGGGSPPAS